MRTVLHRLDVTLRLVAIRDRLAARNIQRLNRLLQSKPVVGCYNALVLNGGSQGRNDGFERAGPVLLNS